MRNDVSTDGFRFHRKTLRRKQRSIAANKTSDTPDEELHPGNGVDGGAAEASRQQQMFEMEGLHGAGVVASQFEVATPADDANSRPYTVQLSPGNSGSPATGDSSELPKDDSQKDDDGMFDINPIGYH